MPYDKKRIGMRLASLRTDKGWNQKDLAKAANISPDSVARYECGMTGMSLEAAYQLTAALGCPLEQLVCRES